MSDDIVERLRDYAKSYRCGFGTTGDLLYEAADRIARLEADLAEANAKIEAARESDRVDLLLALGVESATPKPFLTVTWDGAREAVLTFKGTPFHLELTEEDIRANNAILEAFVARELKSRNAVSDLRERIETIAGYHDPHGNEGVQWCRACGTCFPCVTRVELNAVLSALGEPK